MKTIHICPKCGSMAFYVTAHVTQSWTADEFGSFLSELSSCDEVTHAPDDDDIWECANCCHDAAGRELVRTVTEDEYMTLVEKASHPLPCQP